MECCTGVGELKNISLRMAFCTLHQMFMSVGRGISASRDRILHLSSVVYLWIWGVEWSGGVLEWPEVFSEFSDRSQLDVRLSVACSSILTDDSVRVGPALPFDWGLLARWLLICLIMAANRWRSERRFPPTKTLGNAFQFKCIFML